MNDDRNTPRVLFTSVVVLYSGTQILSLGDRLVVAPIDRLWKADSRTDLCPREAGLCDRRHGEGGPDMLGWARGVGDGPRPS